MSGEGLCERGLLVEGFPDSFSQDRVAELVASETRTCVKHVARALDRPKAWVLLLESHESQKHCLQNQSDFTVAADDTDYTIRLIYPPGKSLPVYPDKWTQVKSAPDLGHTSAPQYDAPPPPIQRPVSAVKPNATYSHPRPTVKSGPFVVESTPNPSLLRSHVTSNDEVKWVPSLYLSPALGDAKEMTYPKPPSGDAKGIAYPHLKPAAADYDSGYVKPRPVLHDNMATADPGAGTRLLETASFSSIKSEHFYADIGDQSASPSLVYASLHPESLPPPLLPKTRSQQATGKPRTSSEIRASPDLSPRTVQFHLKHAPQDAEVFKQYFETITGKGGVESITEEPEEGLVLVTFATIELAHRVVRCQHTIGGSEVRATLCLPPRPKSHFHGLNPTYQGPKPTFQVSKANDQEPIPNDTGPATYPDMLTFRNVPESTDVDTLTLYLVVVSQGNPREIAYSDEPGTIVVTFDKHVDLTAVQARCRERTLKAGVQLSVSLVPVSSCILVEGLSPSTAEEMVTLYFESPRNQGGSVEKVVMIEGGNSSRRCIVVFEERTAATRVLTQTHTISKQEVKVRRYLECLGPTGGSTDPKVFPIPAPVTLDVDKHKRTFIERRPEVADDLTNCLAQEHARFAFTEEGLKCECTVTRTTSNPRQTMKSWATNVQQEVCRFLDQIEILPVDVPREVWSAAEQELSDESFSETTKAMFTLVPESNKCVVVGLQSAAQKLYESISQKIKALKDDADRERKRVPNSYPLKHHEIVLLQALSFDKNITEMYNKLTVNIDHETLKITFNGIAEDIEQARAVMISHLKSIKSKKLGKLSDTQKKMLHARETSGFIETELKSFNIVATWEAYTQDGFALAFSKREDVCVYAFSDEDCVQTKQIISKAIFEEEITDLTPDARRNLQSREWMDLVRMLIYRHSNAIMVTPSPDGQIYVTGREAIVQEVKAELYTFLMEDDIHTEIVRFSPSRQKLLSEFCIGELKEIETMLKDEKVRITVINEQLSIKGTEEGIRLAKGKLEEWDDKVNPHEVNLSDKAQLKFLTSKHCRKHLDSIGRQHQCVISLRFEDKGLLDAGDTDDVQPEYEVTELSDITAGITEPSATAPVVSPLQMTNPTAVAITHVNIVHGEIAKERADVIVNTTSADLDLTNGAVSSSILNVAGSSLQAECRSRYPSGIKTGDMARTGGHGLSCREVFHLALDTWNHNAEQQLTRVIYWCLEEASRGQYTSIAFPALGTGNLGYPREEVARTMFSVVDKFQRDVPTSSLREVKIVVYQKDTETAQVFRQAKSQFQPGRPTPAHRNPPATLGVTPRGVPPPSGPSPLPSVSPGSGIQLHIVDGQIATQRVDVIVNTTSSDLDLSNGAVAASILRVAGSSLQDECKAKYPKGLQKGQIGSTKGHGLSCKGVFYLALDAWATGMDQMLGALIFGCLEKASRNKYTSIAFPALGTGKLGYPCDQVAQTLFTVVDSFQQVMSTNSLKEVRIVIYQDPKTIKAFRDVESQLKGTAPSPVVTPQIRTPFAHNVTAASRRNRTFSDGPNEEPAAPLTSPKEESATDSRFDIRGLTVEIVKGELTDQAVDVLVVPTNGQLQITDETIRISLRQKCGERVEDDLQKKGEDLMKTGMAMTKVDKLNCERILFLNMERLGQDLEKCITKCLKDQDTRIMKTMAIPPLGAGVDNAHISARALYKAVTKFAKDRHSNNLQLLRVVTHDWLTQRTYIEVMQGKGKESPGWLEFIKGKLAKGHEPPSKAPPERPVKKLSASAKRSTTSTGRSLFIYTMQKDSIEKAVTSFKEHVAERVSEKTFPVDENMRYFNTEQITTEIKEAGRRHDVEVDVNLQTAVMTLRGDHDDMLYAWAEINRILNAAQNRNIKKQAVSRTANYVQWYMLEVTRTGVETVAYGRNENHVIEDAYLNCQKTAKITDTNGTVYVIDFDAMTESKEGDPNDVVSVIRRDKLNWNQCVVKMPAQWTPPDPSRPVDVIRLQPTDQEYMDVERNLRATMGKHTVSIKYVERIQNPTLYQQYAAKKSQLEKQNPTLQNERTLWHGTSSDALANINSYGFNRSYCGKNATRFGEGVYFAVNSSYSLNPTYTPQDRSGQRYIYQCKVLTGYYTAGKQGMRFLPNRQDNVLCDSAVDDPRKPDMYIIFNDTQAYPEYIITFT